MNVLAWNQHRYEIWLGGGWHLGMEDEQERWGMH
jgi:hypothetical protein